MWLTLQEIDTAASVISTQILSKTVSSTFLQANMSDFISVLEPYLLDEGQSIMGCDGLAFRL